MTVYTYLLNFSFISSHKGVKLQFLTIKGLSKGKKEKQKSVETTDR